MDLRALKYFVAVKETGSISGASKQCFVAQPSISSSLMQLEETVGRQLFVRHTRGVTATEAGEKLYPLAKQLLGQASALKELFVQETQKTPFKLGLVRGLGVRRMSELLKRFTSKHKDVELTLVPPEDECDARIINKPMMNPNETFISMWQEEFSVAIPHGHPLGLKNELLLKDLQDIPFIQRTPCESWEQLEQALLENKVSLDIRAKIQTVEYAVGLVNAGVGCALLPDYIEIDKHQEFVFRHIEDATISRHIGLAFEQPSAITQSLQKLVVKTIRKK